MPDNGNIFGPPYPSEAGLTVWPSTRDRTKP